MAQSSTIETSPPKAPAADLAGVAGRGALYISLAKIWFMASGYAIHFSLPRLISAEEYGLYQVVIGIISVVNAVVVTGTYQTVSKYISQAETKADSIKWKALRLQLIVGGAISIGVFLLAPAIADNLNDPRLTGYLRLGSLITLSYSFYSVFTGYFNGQRRFLAQAALDSTYSALKLVFIVLFVWLGYGVAGGVGGFALAAACILIVSAIVAGKGNRTGEVNTGDLFRFQIYLLLFTFVLNVLQKVDLMLVKAMSSSDVATASENAGYYGATINIANITYQVIISVTFVIFPLVSEATFANDHQRTKVYITNALRYPLMIMAPLATLFSANAGEVLAVIYPDAYQAGRGALSIVAFGMLFLGLLYIITTIITASGRPTVSLMIGLVTLTASAALNAALIPSRGLEGAAIATTAAMSLGAIVGGAYLHIKFGALMPPLSVIRIAACSGLVYVASLLITPSSRGSILIKLAVLSAFYFASLVITREIDRADLEAVRKVIRK